MSCTQPGLCTKYVSHFFLSESTLLQNDEALSWSTLATALKAGALRTTADFLCLCAESTATRIGFTSLAAKTVAVAVEAAAPVLATTVLSSWWRQQAPP